MAGNGNLDSSGSPLAIWTAPRARQAGYEDGRSVGQAVRAAAVPAEFQLDYQTGFEQGYREYLQLQGPNRGDQERRRARRRK